MKELRVLITVEQLRRAAPGGIGTYAKGLLQGLAQLGSTAQADSDISGAPEVGGPLKLDVELLASRASGAKPDPLGELGRVLHTSRLPGPLLTRGWDRGLLRPPAGFDVVHAVSTATMEPGEAALVTTVHDLLWRQLPETYPRRGRAWHEAALHRSIRRSQRFVVPSAWVAADLYEAGAPEGTVAVIPMGGDHLPEPDLRAGAALLDRLGIASSPFLLSVSTLEPRKNLHRLIEAYGLVRSSLPEPFPLLVVGPGGWGERPAPAPGVVLAGMVTPGELAALYSTALLVAYVPLIEGFGLPPIEAMVLGAPVVASPLPSTGGAAFEVDPHETEAIADGLLTVATDRAVRDRLVQAGGERVRECRWSVVAARHRAVWSQAATPRKARRGR